MDLTRYNIPENIKLKVSIGIALFPDDSYNSKLLVEIAHKRMFSAWEAGGNRIIM
jgi:GGDEF domain-containing protein